MQTITKKEFQELHTNNRIGLVAGTFGKSKETLQELIDNYSEEIKVLPLSRVDLCDQGDIISTRVYIDKDYYYVETLIDSSKDSNTSSNEISVSCIIYKKLN